MAKMSEEQLKNSIKAEEFSCAYLIYGEENYLKQFYVDKLVKKLVDPTFEAFNLHSFDMDNTSLDDILKDAQILPMMSDYNVIVVKDYPIEKLKADLDLLTEYLKDPVETTVLIMWFEVVNPDLKKNSSFNKLIKEFDKAGCVVNLGKRTENEVARLLSSGAKKRGAVLSVDNAKYLISVSGNDMVILLNELEKLSNFAKGGEITRDIIDNMATKSLQAKIFDLSKFIVSGNTDGAYLLLNSLFASKEEPVRLLSIIGGVYVDMYRVKCAKTAGESYEDVMNYYKSDYSGREFVLRNASRDCAKLSVNQLRRSLDEISAADMKMKSTAIDERLLLEELILKLVMIARGELNVKG